MTPEIKQRIEQIKNGEIPEGYKRTKAGTIPEKWEIKKLSDVLKKQTQKNTNNEIQNVLTNSATQGIVCQTEYFDKQIANNENTSGYYIVKPGYFVYNPRISVSAPCGPFNRYNGDKDGIMSPLYSVYCFCDKSITYANFLTYYFSSSKWYAYMNSIANYGARSDRMNVTGEDMNNMPIPYPPLPEQQRIVAILSSQDKVIECYEKKIEQLKRVKKYYLQNMFPKRGEIVPRKRFKGFTDVWEKRKFDDDNDLLSGYPFESEKYSREGIKLVRGMNVKRGYLDLSDEICMRWTSSEGLENYLLEDGDILIQMDGALIGKSYGKIIADQLPALLVQRVTRARAKREKSNSDFMYQIIQRDFLQYIKMNKTETAVPHLSLNDIRNFTIMAPSGEEQTKIGKFFTNLDNLITLHQRKLEEEKKKKKALQQLLLTGIVRTN